MKLRVPANNPCSIAGLETTEVRIQSSTSCGTSCVGFKYIAAGHKFDRYASRQNWSSELKKEEIGRAAAENGSGDMVPSGVVGPEPIAWCVIDARRCACRGLVLVIPITSTRGWLVEAEEVRAA